MKSQKKWFKVEGVSTSPHSRGKFTSIVVANNELSAMKRMLAAKVHSFKLTKIQGRVPQLGGGSRL